MRELTRIETDQTGGGGVPLIVVFLIAMGGSIVVAYVHEKLGGVEGIKRGVKDIVDHVKEQVGNSE